MREYTKPICRGSYALGSACGRCEKCDDEVLAMHVGLVSRPEPKSKVVKLKAYVVYSPCQNRPEVFFGGVASSCAGETAGEEGGFVVELTGELNMGQFVEMWEEQVERYKEQIVREVTYPEDKRTYRNPDRHSAYIKELSDLLESSKRELELAKKNAQES